MEDLGSTVTHIHELTEVYGPFTITECMKAGAAQRGASTAPGAIGVGMIQAESVRVVEAKMQDVPTAGSTAATWA
ncbi:hypothetical protein NF556_16410 [Ornithinimicrobium faecis]|uniref:Uncharacterized protein n=1 Tax=Ornithinimicrobium faecis TaxID=2934158 RepID=A0ABY4YR59_9MICO|nr:hypothetical protein [Ornithinimicrobium sp. HY1793]USQ79184.1 hypothetical protein NF556_16410 [Ornithinimicrobium sp. HY1793]